MVNTRFPGRAAAMWLARLAPAQAWKQPHPGRFRNRSAFIQIFRKLVSTFPKIPREFSSNKPKNANGLFSRAC
jgi:hypothetical protein